MAQSPKQVFILAHPAKHSLSPVMHNAAFDYLGLEAVYSPWDVSPEELPEAMEALRQNDVWGANVTIPHKQAVMPYLDELSDEAQRIGAVNTIINRRGRLIGHNSDAQGYIRGLASAGCDLRGKHVLLLGAGGAARAIVYALLKAGVASLTIANRNPSRAADLAEEFQQSKIDPKQHLATVAMEDIASVSSTVDLIVNSTSVGMAKSGANSFETPLDKRYLPASGCFVSDIVYIPQETRLLKEAKAKGLAVQNGLAMLVHQGAISFECWTGQAAPVESMFAALEKALGTR